MGFGKRATPVRVDPKALFNYSSQDRPVPPFSELLRLSSTEAVEGLTIDGNWTDNMKIPNHAILPPFLSETILDSPQMEATDLIQIVADKIRKRIIQEKAEETGTEEEQNKSDPADTSDEED